MDPLALPARPAHLSPGQGGLLASEVLLAVAVGDALGQPVEGLSADQVAVLTAGRGVSSFLSPFPGSFAHAAGLSAGDTTDDFQLTCVVAEALCVRGVLDEVVLARHHVGAFRSSPLGWGGTTRDAVSELAAWFSSEGVRGRPPWAPAVSRARGHGAGNGVAMKVTPLALLHVLRSASGNVAQAEDLVCDVLALGRLTHDAPDALWCAAALALLLARVALPPLPFTSEDSPELLAGVVSSLSDLGAPRSTLAALEEVGTLLGDVERLRLEVSPSFSAIASVPYAIGVALSYLDDFDRAVLTCVNAGGDSDSTASMCAALVAANLGPDAVPVRWRSLRAAPRAFVLGPRLAAVA